MNTRLRIIFFLVLLQGMARPNHHCLHAQIQSTTLTISTLSAGFSTVTHENGTTHPAVSGTLYYNQARTVAKVVQPVNQIIMLTDSLMTIYYPDSKKGFLFTAKVSFSLPFLHFFLWSLAPGTQLEKSGFRLKKSETSRDTLQQWWTAPQKMKKYLSTICVSYSQRVVCRIELCDAKNRPVSRVTVLEQSVFEQMAVPKVFTVQQIRQNDTTTETVSFSSYVINKPIPDDSMFFTLPLDAQIREVEW
ncbi:MAG: hypothetical protein JW795_09195 [Chitinivibrionales bacterium]|nr:hypothetical protein [Chitinivibrionales bacterium]